MAKYIIQGGTKLHGEITANAGKNYILPALAATLLTDEPCTLRNVPKIRDVQSMLDILQHIGAEITFLDEHTVTVHTPHFKNTDLPREQVKKLRGSVLLLGAMLNRAKQMTMYHPGGDIIGRRSIESHLTAFEQAGAMVHRTENSYELKLPRYDRNAVVVFDEISVTGTENLLLLAASLSATVRLQHTATEPHVQTLCKILKKMGAKIEGIGSSNLIVEGSSHLKGFDYTFGADHVEVGTWAVLAGVTKGNLVIKNVDKTYLDMILLVLSRFGMACELKPQKPIDGLLLPYDPYELHVTPQALKAVAKVDALPWPGFPTDLISILIVLASQAPGATLMRDWMYDGRMFFTDKLITMGAQIVLCDPHRVLVYGPAVLSGKNLESPDVRAGMAMILAALAAKGESVISLVEHVERDYADVPQRLGVLGAKIDRIED